MLSRHVLSLLVGVGWCMSYAAGLQAQEAPHLPLPAPPAETTESAGVPPTPQFIQVNVDLGPPGPNLRLYRHPAWVALYTPRVQVRQGLTASSSTAETAPPLEGGAEQLYQALEEALNRAQSSATP